jgi:hypothetical protein
VRVCVQRGWFLNAVPGRKPREVEAYQLLDAYRVADVTPVSPSRLFCTLPCSFAP